MVSRFKWMPFILACIMLIVVSSCGTSGWSGTYSGSNVTWDADFTDEYNGVELNIRGSGEAPEYLHRAINWTSAADTPTIIRKIIIEDGITSINRNSFEFLPDVTYISIPASVEMIAPHAFDSCASLENIEIDPRNEHYQSVDGVLFDKELTTLIRCPRSAAELNLPNSLNSIANGACYSCEKISEVVIPESVSAIGEGAFWDCTNLATIVIPDTVTEIKDDGSGFNGIGHCFANTKWYNDQPDGLVYAGRILCGYKGDMSANLDLVLREGTTQICDLAFENCTGLQSIEIPQGVKSIGIFCFSGCENLISITIPDSVTYIGPGAFYECNAADIYYKGTDEQWKAIDRNQPGVTP